MKQTNFSEFYLLLKKLPGAVDGLKEELVSQFTNSRTESLREMEVKEYKAMCSALRERVADGMEADAFIKEIKRRRSAVLKRLQQIGIDTTKFSNVDHYCLSPKISGKRFAQLSLDELSDLVKKLEAILRKERKKKMELPDELVRVAGMCWN